MGTLRALALLSAGLMIMAGCTLVPGASTGPAASPTPTTGDIAFGTGDSELVLRVAVVGGLVPPDYTFGAYPRISIYGDGRLITEGPQSAIYPGPMLPNLQVAKLARSDIAKLLARAKTLGLFQTKFLDQTGIMDAGTTVLTINADGQAYVMSAYALFEAQASLPAQPAAGSRAAMVALLAEIDRLTGQGTSAGTSPYATTSLRLRIGPYTPDPAPAQTARAWPLATSPLPDGDSGSACVTVRGVDAQTLIAAFGRASELTPWVIAGSVYAVRVRLDLPNEDGCPAITS